MLRYFMKVVFRIRHILNLWKVARLLMIPKTGKPRDDLTGQYGYFQWSQNYLRDYS